MTTLRRAISLASVRARKARHNSGRSSSSAIILLESEMPKSSFNVGAPFRESYLAAKRGRDTRFQGGKHSEPRYWNADSLDVCYFP